MLAGSGIAAGSYMSQYLPGSVHGWCGSGNEHQGERLFGPLPGVPSQPRHGLAGDIVRGIDLFAEVGAPRLRRHVARIAHAVFASHPRRRFGMFPLQPPEIVAEALVRMVVAVHDLLETVIGQAQAVIRMPPARPQLLPIQGRIDRVAPGFRERCGGRRHAGAGHRRRQHGRVVLERLEVALADQGRAVARLGKQVREGDGLQGQRDAVAPHPVHRRHPASQQGASVRHADGIGDVGAFEAHAVAGEPVDMRRAHDRIAVAAEMVRAMLVGDEDEKVRTCWGHRSNPSIDLS